MNQLPFHGIRVKVFGLRFFDKFISGLALDLTLEIPRQVQNWI